MNHFLIRSFWKHTTPLGAGTECKYRSQVDDVKANLNLIVGLYFCDHDTDEKSEYCIFESWYFCQYHNYAGSNLAKVAQFIV